MTTNIIDATGTYKFTSWDEKPYAELDGAPKLTHAVFANAYGGDLAGEGHSQVVMFYASEASATCAGFERVTGSLAGRKGSFVLRIDATFENGEVKTAWSVVPGSGTSELAGLRGNGGYIFRTGEAQATYQLQYHFD